MRATFRKHERLIGRDRVKAVATRGRAVHETPFRLVGLLMPLDTVAPAQVAFAVPKRNLRKAVQRNRTRRLMREAYRLNKERWYERLRTAGLQCAWLFVFQGSAVPGWAETHEKITRAMDRWLLQHVPGR